MNDEQAHGIVSEPKYHVPECMETRGATRSRMQAAIDVKCFVTLAATRTMTVLTQASNAGGKGALGERQ